MRGAYSSESGAAWKFAVVDDEDYARLCSVLDLEGFFTEGQPYGPLLRSFTLLGANSEGRLQRLCRRSDTRQELGNVEVWVLNNQGVRIGSYFVGGVIVEGCDRWQDNAGLSDITMTGVFHTPPHPGAGSVWDQWRFAPPTRRDLWAVPALEGREAWLEVAQLHQSAVQGSQAADRTHVMFDVHGEFINDKAGLYCALGEAVNGPGGYFGAGLDGLADCLRGGFGAKPPFTFVWNASRATRMRLGAYFSQVIDCLEMAGVTVRLYD